MSHGPMVCCASVKAEASYGGSLSWDVPSNMTHMVEPLLSNWEFNLNHTNLCAFNQKNQSTCIILLKPVIIYVES